MIRNIASHDYETSYNEIADHFSALHTSIPQLLSTGVRLMAFCKQSLEIAPNEGAFSTDYLLIAQHYL